MRFYKIVCPFVHCSVHFMGPSCTSLPMRGLIFLEVSMDTNKLSVGAVSTKRKILLCPCPCPTVCNDIMTLHHLFFSCFLLTCSDAVLAMWGKVLQHSHLIFFDLEDVLTIHYESIVTIDRVVPDKMRSREREKERKREREKERSQ